MANGTTTKVSYPDSVKIGAKSYDIHWSADEWHNKPEDGNSKDAWALTSHPKLGIWISPDLHPVNKRESLLHEILHCLFAGSGADARNAVGAGDDQFDIEEYIITRLEAPLFAVLQDNPGVLAYIVIGADIDRE